MEERCKMTDEALVSLFAKGDNLAFDVLLDRHKDRLYNYILMLVHHREQAEDIFQDTFVRAITTIKNGRYAETGRFGAWLCRIAHNQVIDEFRRLQNENTVSNDENEEIDLFNNAKLTDDNIEDRLVREQVDADVCSLMDHLPDQQREVVFLRYYQDYSFKEIADMTGVSINTALGRMRYAVMNMRRMAKENDLCLAI